jgi:transaldolase
MEGLKIKIFADGADLSGIGILARDPLIQGFTTNPSLMWSAGVGDYETYAREILQLVTDRPVSLEVTVDEPEEMLAQAKKMAAWGPNVYVKIPVVNTKGIPTNTVIQRLSAIGIRVNVTAVFTLPQVANLVGMLYPEVPAIVSVFAGRIADTGRDPIPHMRKCKSMLEPRPKAELLWASTREFLNIYHAESAGCDIITVPHSIWGKRYLVGKDLTQYSRETVQAFFNDGRSYNAAP